MQSGPLSGAAAENKRPAAVALRPRLWLPRHPQRREGGLLRQGDRDKAQARIKTAYKFGAGGTSSLAETDAVFGSHLRDHPPLNGLSRLHAQIGIQILGGGYQHAATDAGLAASCAKTR